MTAVFLSRVEFENFRTFGRFALDIPPGPGLTLITGTNGLGKSSFFDGIEWCLTDQVSRFNGHISRLKECDYLTRRDASKNSHIVSLQFTTGAPIVRTAKTKPNKADIINLLRNPSWGEVKDLDIHLAFTHFLGQAAQQRFTSRKHNEQWEALKGPSGIDRLEDMRTTLRGRTTGNAFRRRIDEQKTRVTEAESKLDTWKESSARLKRLQRAAAASGAIEPTAFGAGLNNLAHELEALTGNAIDPTPTDRGEYLIVLREFIERESTTTRNKNLQLEALRVVIENFLRSVEQSDQSGKAIQDVKARVAEAESALATMTQASGEAAHSVTNQAAIVASENSGVDRLASMRRLIEDRVRRTRERQDLINERSKLQSSLAEQGKAIQEARSRLTQAIDSQSRRAQLEEHHLGLTKLVVQANEILSLELTVITKQEAARAAGLSARNARLVIDSLRDEIFALERRIKEGEQRVIELKQKASDVAEALAKIAGHLTEHDTSCPICASSFPPGVLKSLGEAAASLEDAALTEQTRINQSIFHERDLKRLALTEAEGMIGAASTCSKEADAAQAALTTARNAVARGLNVPPDSDLADIAAQRLTDVNSLLAEMVSAEAGGTQSVFAARNAIKVMEDELTLLRRRVAVVDEQYVNLEENIGRIDQSLATFADPLPTLEDVTRQIEIQQKQAAAAREKLSVLEERRASFVKGEASARELLRAIQGEHSRISAAIGNARREMDTITSKWKSAGLSGFPSHEDLNLRVEALARRSGRLAQLLDTHSALYHAHEVIIAQSELQIAISEMERQGGVGSSINPAEHELRLQQQLTRARDELQATESTQVAVNAYAEQLKEEADSFSTQFLKPLNKLIDNFNRALLSAPGETVQFSAAPAVDRTQFGMQLRYADEVDNARYNTQLPPQLVLSEGQMAANGFSILCAASTAYPWANWRSLLLDDPLQHNDVIHAAAFVDVMRNLVELKDYQLIMSSHDRAETEFLARKFDAAGLPCTVLTLTAPSVDGVRYAPPRYNAAARALMLAKGVHVG